MFAHDRQQLRKAYADAWKKSQQQQTLTPLEQQIVDVIQEHPEYHASLQQLESDFLPESGQTNPFLHLGMHLGLREQLSTNRPLGIRDCYQALCNKYKSSHQAEHDMMECLGEIIWQAQKTGTAPDESIYLSCLKKKSGLK
jgi:hypothetical protein